MYKVTSFKICPFFQYVNSMLLATDTPFEEEYTSFDNCLFDRSPNGKAPLLMTPSAQVLFDADAIIEYIQTTAYPLYFGSTQEQAALIKAWANFGSKNYVAQCSTMRSPDKASFEANLAIFDKSLVTMEKQLTDSRYFSGEQLSIVDISWLTILYRAQLVKENTGFDFLTRLPKLKKWQANLLALPFVVRTVAEDFETVFSDFYLSGIYLSVQKSIIIESV